MIQLPHNIKAALFDMDGVLYDSMGNHASAWQSSMAEFGLNMTREDAYACEGMRGVETIRKIMLRERGEDITDEAAMEIYHVKSEHYSRFGTAGLIPGIRELQRMLLDNGIKIGVVTGSGQYSLLNRLLTDFADIVSPDIIVTAHDVQQGKPAPDPYLQGMKKAGTQPTETIVVENAPLGIRSAVAAGCFTIAVNTGPLPDSLLLDEGASLLFHDMFEARQALCALVKVAHTL